MEQSEPKGKSASEGAVERVYILSIYIYCAQSVAINDKDLVYSFYFKNSFLIILLTRAIHMTPYNAYITLKVRWIVRRLVCL